MHELIQGFPAQLEAALGIADAAQLPAAKAPIHHVAVLGLGGSAFGGDLVDDTTRATRSVPLQVFRGYNAPAFLGPNSLVILSSYSGNTEETLSAAAQALEKGVQAIAITSGGKLKALAEHRGFPVITLPPGYPPRAAAGFSYVQQLRVLHHYDLIPDFRPALADAIRLLTGFPDRSAADALAQQLHNRVPILYASDTLASIALRWRQQINENSKQLCWHHIVPEMNHNELVGWQHPTWLFERASVVLLRSQHDHPRVGLRYGINAEIFTTAGTAVHEVWARGEGLLQQLLYLLHYGDWLSLKLAELNGVAATPVQVIDYLKSELAAQA